MVILAGIVAVLTGLAIWKPVQFQVLTNFFGEFDRPRHFIAMCAIFLLLVLLVVMALAVPKSLRPNSAHLTRIRRPMAIIGSAGSQPAVGAGPLKRY